TFMLGNAGVTQPSLIVIDALRTDVRGLLATRVTREDWRIIPSQHLDGFFLPLPYALCYHPQLEFRCSTEIVLVGARHPRNEHILQGDVHAPGPEFPGTTGDVVLAIHTKLAHVPTAFEPDASQKSVEGGQRGISMHFEMQPVRPVAVGHQVEELGLTPFAAGGGSLQHGLPL